MFIHTHRSEGLFWLRIFGYGFYIKDLKVDNTLTWKQRYGYEGINILDYHIGTLKKLY
jgi:hypothetical protein